MSCIKKIRVIEPKGPMKLGCHTRATKLFERRVIRQCQNNIYYKWINKRFKNLIFYTCIIFIYFFIFIEKEFSEYHVPGVGPVFSVSPLLNGGRKEESVGRKLPVSTQIKGGQCSHMSVQHSPPWKGDGTSCYWCEVLVYIC